MLNFVPKDLIVPPLMRSAKMRRSSHIPAFVVYSLLPKLSLIVNKDAYRLGWEEETGWSPRLGVSGHEEGEEKRREEVAMG